jgi:uncharacterized membrane protein YcaP (DUF421 family)
MDYMTIIFRTIFVYIILTFLFRLMGKREIGQLSILDFVVSIMIAELAVLSLEEPNEPILKSLTGVFVLVGIQISLSILSLKSGKIREIVDGKPSIIIDRGKVDEKEMRKQRYNFDDLLIQLREKDITRLSDVEFAILESSGKLSVIKKDENSERFNFPLPLILDGEIQEEHLKRMNKTSMWIKQELRKLGFRDAKEISFCSLNKDGGLYVDLKDESK